MWLPQILSLLIGRWDVIQITRFSPSPPPREERAGERRLSVARPGDLSVLVPCIIYIFG
jgi:hypothetical protein